MSKNLAKHLAKQIQVLRGIFPYHDDRNLAKHLAKHNPKFLVRFGMLTRTLPRMKTWMNVGKNLALHKKVPWSPWARQVSLLGIVDRPEKNLPWCELPSYHGKVPPFQTLPSFEVLVHVILHDLKGLGSGMCGVIGRCMDPPDALEFLVSLSRVCRKPGL